MIRTFLPSDLIAILFQGESLSNKAKTKDGMGRKEARFLTMATLLGQWLHPRVRRCLWVWTRGLRLRGLASARNRSSSHTWEVDRLLINEGDDECCCSLLERLILAGGESGVEKIFLRLPMDSSLVDAAQKAGFLPYITEFLYGLQGGKGTVNGDIPPLTPRLKQVGDDYRLFELYQNCIPAPIRRVEGMTFKEWQEIKDRTAKREWIFEQEGSLIGWLRMESNRATEQFEVMASGERELEQIVLHTLLSSDSHRRLLCLTREFQGELARLLQDRGFDEIKRYSVFIKELTVKTQEPCFVPLSA